MEYTYIWDGVNSLDNSMMGFLPKNMIDIMFKYQKRKSYNEIKKILLSWANKLNSLIFDKLWKIRNDLMIEWEISVNITKKLKKRSILKNKPNKNSYKKQRDGLPNPSSNRKRLKRGIRVGKQSTVHHIDELTYRAIKLDVGLNDFDFTL